MGKRAERVRDSFMGRTAESLKRDSPVAERGGEKDEGGGERGGRPRERGGETVEVFLSLCAKEKREVHGERRERERANQAGAASSSLAECSLPSSHLLRVQVHSVAANALHEDGRHPRSEIRDPKLRGRASKSSSSGL